MIDLFAWLGSVLAVFGVVANNHRLRWCFLAFFVSNSIALVIHTVYGLLPYAGRDLVFMVLSVHGWFKWSGKSRYQLTGYEILKKAVSK